LSVTERHHMHHGIPNHCIYISAMIKNLLTVNLEPEQEIEIEVQDGDCLYIDHLSQNNFENR